MSCTLLSVIFIYISPFPFYSPGVKSTCGVFGCYIYVHSHDPNLIKLDPRALLVFLLIIP